jgi:hypothetical protein
MSPCTADKSLGETSHTTNFELTQQDDVSSGIIQLGRTELCKKHRPWMADKFPNRAVRTVSSTPENEKTFLEKHMDMKQSIFQTSLGTFTATENTNSVCI